MKSVSKFKNVSNNDIWNSENIYHLKIGITRISKIDLSFTREIHLLD